MNYFEKENNYKCISLLINSVSENIGLGMYENIRFALLNQERGKVIEGLRSGLQSSNVGVLFQYCWRAVDVEAWELSQVVEALLFHNNVNVKKAANEYILLKNESA